MICNWGQYFYLFSSQKLTASAADEKLSSALNLTSVIWVSAHPDKPDIMNEGCESFWQKSQQSSFHDTDMSPSALRATAAVTPIRDDEFSESSPVLLSCLNFEAMKANTCHCHQRIRKWRVGNYICSLFDICTMLQQKKMLTESNFMSSFGFR